MEIKNRYGKIGMMAAVLALIAVMSTPSAMASPQDEDVMSVTWDDPDIVATVSNFHNPCHWHQLRYYQPGSSADVGPYDLVTNSDGYFTSEPWVPINDGDPYTDEFNVEDSGAQSNTGISWRVCLCKDGKFKKGDTDPQDTTVPSPRGCKTVGDDFCIPEFATIAIPIVALLGLVAFYRRKQKK